MARSLIAISRLGSIGFQHPSVFAARPDVRIIAIDPDARLRRRAEAVTGVDAVYAEFERLLDAAPEASVIAGPDHVHLPQLIAAAERGITAMVEKPLAPTNADEVRPAQTIDASGTAAMVGYVLRHRAVVQRTREILGAAEIGTPITAHVMLGAYGMIVAAVSRFATAESDRLYRDYSHEWDYLWWFFGPMTRAFAAARTVSGVPHVEQPNCVEGLLEFESGLRATFPPGLPRTGRYPHRARARYSWLADGGFQSRVDRGAHCDVGSRARPRSARACVGGTGTASRGGPARRPGRVPGGTFPPIV